jgi:hypothetical protein
MHLERDQHAAIQQTAKHSNRQASGPSSKAPINEWPAYEPSGP